MAFGGVALKGVSWFLRFIEFCCAAIILAIFSYFLAVLHNHDLHIDTYIRAVEGIAGAGVLYTIFAIILVCCLGGIAFFSMLGMILDFCFTGGFAYIAYATRHGDSCSGFVQTPLGDGDPAVNNSVPNGNDGFTKLPSLHTACKLNTASLAVSIIAAIFFFLSIFVEYGLIRHHKKEKAFGPSPNNGYTAGSPRRKFWQRGRAKKNRDAEFASGALGAEKHPDALPAHTTPAAVRNSYATDTTAVGNEPVYDKYGHTNPVNSRHSHGYSTTTTTHTPYASNVGTTTQTPYPSGVGATEMPADGYQRTHQTYNNNPTGTF